MRESGREQAVLFGFLPPKPPISLIGGKFGVCLGVYLGYRLQCFSRLYFTPERLSTDVTVRKLQYRVDTVIRVSTQRKRHNFIVLPPYFYFFTLVLAVARPFQVRPSHCVRIQTHIYVCICHYSMP